LLPVKSINIGSLMLSLSDALDLVSPSLSSHQLRTAYICVELGKSMRLSEERLAKLFVAASLHDIGALTSGEKVAVHDSQTQDLQPHCLRGAMLFQDLPWLDGISWAIERHHTPWTDLGEPLDAPFVLEAQLIYLADLVERSVDRGRYILHQNDGLTASIRDLSGSTFHPDVVDRFMAVSASDEFWLDLTSPRLYEHLLRGSPFQDMPATRENLRQVAQLFRNIVDFRSSFTATHSAGVTQCAGMLACRSGFSDEDVFLMELAASLHDLGKVVIPNSILEKPAGLSREEFAVMRQHTYWTYTLLHTIGGFERVAEWAAFHHEKLDGSGYPFRLPARRISAGSRIMAVADVSTALIEDRPYRKGLAKDRVILLLRQKVGASHLDPAMAELLYDHYGEVEGAVREKQATAMDLYKRKFSSPSEASLLPN
jgi:HD-GYP domain-containing protein (c-di-GMP phosphodiesterase class II)